MPTKEIVYIPISFALDNAFRIFLLSPDVEIAIKISLSVPIASSCREKTSSNVKSLLIEVITEVSVVNEIALYNKALFYQSKLAWNDALDSYAALHKVKPFHSSGHYNLGFIHMELGLFDVAANNFSDAIYSDSQFYEAYYSRGNCFETLGNIAQAESDYKRAIEINSEYTYAIEALSALREKNIKYN